MCGLDQLCLICGALSTFAVGKIDRSYHQLMISQDCRFLLPVSTEKGNLKPSLIHCMSKFSNTALDGGDWYLKSYYRYLSSLLLSDVQGMNKLYWFIWKIQNLIIQYYHNRKVRKHIKIQSTLMYIRHYWASSPSWKHWITRWQIFSFIFTRMINAARRSAVASPAGALCASGLGGGGGGWFGIGLNRFGLLSLSRW